MAWNQGNDMKNNIHSNKQHFSSGEEYNIWLRSRLEAPIDYKLQETWRGANFKLSSQGGTWSFTTWKILWPVKERLKNPCTEKHTKSIDITLSKSNYVNTLWWWVYIVHRNIIQQAFHVLWSLGIGGRCPQIAQDITPRILQMSILRSKVGLDSSTRRKGTSLWSCRGDARSQ